MSSTRYHVKTRRGTGAQILRRECGVSCKALVVEAFAARLAVDTAIPPGDAAEDREDRVPKATDACSRGCYSGCE